VVCARGCLCVVEAVIITLKNANEFFATGVEFEGRPVLSVDMDLSAQSATCWIHPREDRPVFVDEKCGLRRDESGQMLEMGVAGQGAKLVVACEPAKKYVALHAACSPSATTRFAYAGEFSFEDKNGDKQVVPWATIKQIMAEIRSSASIFEDRIVVAANGVLMMPE